MKTPEKNQLLEVLERILSAPTAPFHEYHVRDVIAELLSSYPNISLTEDHFGNLIASYGSPDSPLGWALCSHMDHPGWVRSLPDATSKGLKLEGYRQRGNLTFLGGVPENYFCPDVPIIEYGDFAMWDLPAFDVDADNRLHSRACDDLIGCAAIVNAMIELDRSGIDAHFVAIFTRAEEVGFVGAIAAASDSPLREETCFVSIETSIPTDCAKMGEGPMCRVGDRLSTFDHRSTAAILASAKQHEIPVQRALLDRGACEATALQAYGFTTAGISVALGNYHNCGPENQIQAEFVALTDVEALTTLIQAMVKDHPQGPNTADTYKSTRQGFTERLNKYQPFINATQSHFGK